ncbi:hypothetical protein ACJJTC_003932 [Scirpophaga incertulas]
MSEPPESDISQECLCTEPESESRRPPNPDCVCSRDERGVLIPDCVCPRDEHDIVIHQETCLLYKNETIIFPHDPESCECQSPRFVDSVCRCCACPEGQCRCRKAGRQIFDEWRSKRDFGAMPAVLEPTHPLMQRFQQTLKQFLEKENAIAAEEILNLREELKLSKQAYEQDLETIYRSDHDTNAQRVLIEEYESSLAQRTSERQAADQRARHLNDQYKRAKEKLDQSVVTEREVTEELEALSALCRQLEAWREETESDLTVSQRMSDKMRAEKRALAGEKRQLDMIIYGLSNEVWKLESKLELYHKQLEIKNVEMENINDKVTAYAAELEDLELDKRRLVSLWNSVLVNIQQRDKVFDSVRDDYKSLQENYRTLINNLEITKKVVMEEMNRSKDLSMNRDKVLYDIEHATKIYDAEDVKRLKLEAEIGQLSESIEMSERDQAMIQSENQTMMNILKNTEKELDRKAQQKLNLENEILVNLQECLLNDKAVESMANGIKKMRELSRKHEVTLSTMENQHAKVMLDIEIYRGRQVRNNNTLEETIAKVKAREEEIEKLQEKYNRKTLLLTRKQRELDIIIKKFTALKEIFDLKSPQERRIEELEQQIKGLRERTEDMQQEWLRLQGHVVKVTAQHQKVVADINLINKQIQICEQKTMRIEAECEGVAQERARVDRSARALRSRLETLERSRRATADRNDAVHRTVQALTYEYVASLKDSENEILQLEEDIEALDKEKVNLTQDLDRVQREALIWQRKGVLAVELKKNISNAKSAVGEIGQMRNEIHRMEVRREQLRKTSEKLAEDMALYVTRRENALEKNRAQAAIEKAHGSSGHTSQSTYHHRLRLARADVARASKELTETSSHLEQLQQEAARLEAEVAHATESNARLEDNIAALVNECHAAERRKHWVLERVVRSQRLGSELAAAAKRRSVRVRRPRAAVCAEYENAHALNERLRSVARTLASEYPHLGDRLEAVLYTLDIHSPETSPRLVDDAHSQDQSTVDDQSLDEVPEKL